MIVFVLGVFLLSAALGLVLRLAKVKRWLLISSLTFASVVVGFFVYLYIHVMYVKYP